MGNLTTCESTTYGVNVKKNVGLSSSGRKASVVMKRKFAEETSSNDERSL